MRNIDLRTMLFTLGGVAGLTMLGWLIAYLRRKTPEQREQERRLRLQGMGRIIDGTVTDSVELDAESARRPAGMDLILYRYDVAGVTYEASQDVTSLRPTVDLQRCHLGLPCSVRYDPLNPANSIVISEEWSGLRQSVIRMPRAAVAQMSEPGAEAETN